MFAVVFDTHGIELARYLLGDDDLVDCRIYADRYLEPHGYTTYSEDSYCGDGDVHVVLTDDPDNTAVCWKSEGFFVDFGEE